MPLPSFQKAWTISPNNRYTPFVSLNDCMSAVLFSGKNFLVSTMGNSVVYSCNGTTGPTSGTDHTDRISSKANLTTRAANRYQAQSWVVIQDGNGAQLLFSYLGASDDIATIRYSSSAIYTPAASAAASFNITAFNSGTGNCTATGHGQVTGNGPFYFSTTGFPTPFAQDVPYWVFVVDANTFRICSTRANALAGIFITPGGVGTPPATFTNGGTSQPPTADDEVVIVTGQTLINGTTSGDRVWHFWSSSDKKMFRWVLLRSSAIQFIMGLEQITSAVLAPAALPAGVWAYFHTDPNFSNNTGAPHYSNSGTFQASNYKGGMARVHSNGVDQSVPLVGMFPSWGGTNMSSYPFTNEKTYLQGQTGELLYLLQKGVTTTQAATADGVLGTCIDWWITFSGGATGANIGDFMGTLQFVVIGTATVWPWDQATTQFQMQ